MDPSLDEPLTEEEIIELTIINGRSLKRFLAYPEWEVYERMLKARIEQMEKTLLEPVSGIEKVFEAERVKGAIHGLRLALTQPRFMVEAAEKLQAEQLEEEDDDNGH